MEIMKQLQHGSLNHNQDTPAMINKILRKNKPKESWSSYIERGKDSREWKEMMKAKIKYLREDLNREIIEYIKEYGRQDIHDPS